MGIEQRFWTFGEMLDKVHADTDISEDDPDQQFVTFNEMVGYFNEGIDEAESEIHKIDEDYFLSSDFLVTKQGVSNYPMPKNIYADKLRGIIYDNGSLRYQIPKVRRKELFKKISLLQGTTLSIQNYWHFIRNDKAGKRTFVLLPPAKETSVIAPAGPPVTFIQRWFIRNANEIPLVGVFTNPETLLPVDFDLSTGEITVDPDFPYVTGDVVQFSLDSEIFTLPDGLVESTNYYVIRVSATKVKLATTLAGAKAGANGLLNSNKIQESPVEVVNGIRVDFSLSQIPASNSSVQVYLDGVFQRQGIGKNYTILGQTVTFAVAPLADRGDGQPQQIDFIYYPLTAVPAASPTEVQEDPAGLIDGANLIFTLSATPSSNAALSLTIDGVLQKQGVAYNINGRTITFVAPFQPAIGQELDATYDTSVLFFSNAGTGFFTMKVQATKKIVLATVVDIPEFAIFIMEWVKANVLFKDSDPRLAQSVAKLEEQRKQMVETLTDREPDDDNTVELDLTFYTEMN